MDQSRLFGSHLEPGSNQGLFPLVIASDNSGDKYHDFFLLFTRNITTGWLISLTNVNLATRGRMSSGSK